MFLFLFFSFVRITTYSFLMLLKIPYEFMGMLWWLPCALKVCQFSRLGSCSLRVHHLQSFHMYSGKKVVCRRNYRDRLLKFVLVHLDKNSTSMMMKKK